MKNKCNTQKHNVGKLQIYVYVKVRARVHTMTTVHKGTKKIRTMYQ